MKTRRALLILAAAATAGSVYADKVQFSQTPPAVQQAVRAKAGRHQIEDVDRNVVNGQPQYEVSWKERGAQQELLLSEAGTILRDVVAPGASNGLAQQNLTLANKTGVALTDTPRKVQAAIYNQIPTAPIDGVQKGTWNGQNIYEVTYHDNGQLKTFQVTESGQPVVGKASATGFQPRYAAVSDQNVPLSAGAKMALESAPQPVQRTVQHVANGARIEDFERGTWNGRTVYQAAYKNKGQNTELQVFEDGTIVTKAPGGTTLGAAQASTGAVSANGGRGVADAQNNPGLLRGSPYPTLARPRAVTGAAAGVRYAGLADSNVQLSGGNKLPFNEAPQPVRNTIQQVAGGAQVEDMERGIWNGRTVYEAAFKHNGQNVELQILDDGSVLTKQLPAAMGSAPIGAVGSGQQ